MTSCAQSAFAKLCFEPGASPHTFDTSSEPYDFLRENVKKHGRILQSAGNRGTRSRSIHRRRNGAYLCGGPIIFEMTPRLLDNMLPRILGANEATDLFALAETLPSFGVLINRVTSISSGHFQYKDCKVDKALITGQAGPGDEGPPEYIHLILWLAALNEVTGTSYPVLTLPTAANDAAYVQGDIGLGFVLQGAARRPKKWSILVDNHLIPRVTTSFTADTYCPGDRTVAVSATFPFDDDHDDLYNIGTSGLSAAITMTNGYLDTTLNFGQLDAPADSPGVPPRGNEIDIEVDFIAGKTDAANEFSVTNDSNASAH